MANPQEVYCSMIHGGLNLDIKEPQPFVKSCCLRNDRIPIIPHESIWQKLDRSPLRQVNAAGQWDPGCNNCQSLEKAGMQSFRQGMNQGLDIYGQVGLKGPARLDLMFDLSCNLACRTCGPHSSTFWQKHLQSFGEWNTPIFATRKKNEVIDYLDKLDLSNLRQVVFCGGETLLGQEYWDVSRWFTNYLPDSKTNLTLCFQTNGTQDISTKNFDVIEKCKLVKLHISLDGTDRQFEYLRWPASWNQVTDNLSALREKLPSNVMFLVEQTISVFNILYVNRVDNWIKKYFATNREQDPVDCTKHLARGRYHIANCSREIHELLQQRAEYTFFDHNWQENPKNIAVMLDEIKKFDSIRQQRFQDVFPEAFEAFRRFW